MTTDLVTFSTSISHGIKQDLTISEFLILNQFQIRYYSFEWSYCVMLTPSMTAMGLSGTVWGSADHMIGLRYSAKVTSSTVISAW